MEELLNSSIIFYIWKTRIALLELKFYHERIQRPELNQVHNHNMGLDCSTRRG